MKAKREQATTQILPREEWDFFSKKSSIPDVREWNAWLNYEYARSCRPILEAVRQVRGGKPPAAPDYRFAVFLEKQFPEFPKTPWLEISPARRGDLRAKGIIPENDPFEDRKPFLVYDANDFVCSVMEESVSLTNSIHGDQFSVFEIDFAFENRVLTQAFAAWLDLRREFLFKKYDQQIELRSGGTFNPKFAFEPRPFRRRPGQAKNKRQYKNYLSRLAALRLVAFHGNWLKAEYDADLHGGRPFYQGQKSWLRAADEAGDLMMRFVAVWKYAHGFPFILDPTRNIHELLPDICCSPLPLATAQMRNARPSIREFIKNQVVTFEEVAAFKI
jgi:hypothetical protein